MSNPISDSLAVRSARHRRGVKADLHDIKSALGELPAIKRTLEDLRAQFRAVVVGNSTRASQR
jgi:hypothetical protein